jgi:spermidine synthase
VLFGQWAKERGASFYSIDINPKAVEASKHAVDQTGGSAIIICGDSLAFLEDFPNSIDFLYLDSFDYDFDNPNSCQQHHLKEIQTAYSKLKPTSVVMVDDCDLPQGGKCKLVIDFLLAKGWTIYDIGYQVLMVQD